MRPMEPADAEGLFALDSNPNVHRYLGNRPVTKISQCHAIIEAIQKQYETNGIARYSVFLKSTDVYIGWAGIKFVTTPENGHIDFYDIGYRLLEAYWGKGYASEAAFAWRDHAFDTMEIPVLCASAHIDNTGSNIILQKIGMQMIGQYDYDGLPCNWYQQNRPSL